VYHDVMVEPYSAGSAGLSFRAPSRGLDEAVMERLKAGLGGCPDVAFAHLVESWVTGHKPALTLFVWIVPQAMGSIRSALNLVCRTVGESLPDETFVDVVILNSAPELLAGVEAVGCLLVERDPGERRRALEGARAGMDEPPDTGSDGGWWPFGRR